MKNSFKFVLLLFLLGTAFFLEGKNITVKGKDIIIIAPDPAKSKLAYDAGKAAEDLKEHLFLLTGADVPIVQKSVPGKPSNAVRKMQPRLKSGGENALR